MGRSRDENLHILFEDNHCLALAKPPRMLVASDRTGDETLLDRARAYIAEKAAAKGMKGYLAPLHFLDRPVSGVILFAKSSKAASRLAQAFRNRGPAKIYHALVEGRPPKDRADLVDFLLKDHDENLVAVVPEGTSGAKRSSLSYHVVGRHGPYTLVEVELQTGRSHQIRVQLASRGMIIAGDRKYGSALDLGGAIALHAESLSFDHPTTRERITVVAPKPAFWEELRKAAPRAATRKERSPSPRRR